MASKIGPYTNLILGYRKPYMGVGRNMAYKKSLFMTTGGFESHAHVMSGDDDLFVQESSTMSNVSVAIEQDAQTISDSRPSFVKWFLQKKRHSSTGFHYNFSSLFLLGLIQVNCIVFYSALLFSIWNGYYLWLVIGLASIRFYSQYIVLKKSARRLGEMDLLLLSLILELPLIILNLAAAVSNILFMNRRWI